MRRRRTSQGRQGRVVQCSGKGPQVQFSTVSLGLESPEVVARFAGHYLAAGAKRVTVFHDGLLPEGWPAPREGLEIVACDDAFWAAQGGRPEALEERQAAVYAVGLARCPSPWMLAADLDEFVFGETSIAAFLAAVPEACDAVRIPVAEAVWGPGDDPGEPWGSSYFRLPWRSGRLWQLGGRLVYGDVARFMRAGLLGHVDGKQFIRTGRAYSRIGNINTRRDGVVVTRTARELGPGCQGLWLGHFDAIGFERWSTKWRLRQARLAVNMSAAREAQMAMILAALDAGEPEARRVFRRFFGISRAQHAALAALGCCFRRRLFD